MTRMELGPNVPHHLCLWTGVHPALGHLARAPVNDFVPLRLGVCVHGVIKAGNELAGQTGPVLLRQGHHFGGDFLCGNAHGEKIIQINGGFNIRFTTVSRLRFLRRFFAFRLIFRLARAGGLVGGRFGGRGQFFRRDKQRGKEAAAQKGAAEEFPGGRIAARALGERNDPARDSF
jgi:hypothetical protein